MSLFTTDPSTGRKYLSTRKRSGKLPRTHCKTKLVWKEFKRFKVLLCPSCGKIVHIDKRSSSPLPTSDKT